MGVVDRRREGFWEGRERSGGAGNAGERSRGVVALPGAVGHGCSRAGVSGSWSGSRGRPSPPGSAARPSDTTGETLSGTRSSAQADMRKPRVRILIPGLPSSRPEGHPVLRKRSSQALGVSAMYSRLVAVSTKPSCVIAWRRSARCAKHTRGRERSLQRPGIRGVDYIGGSLVAARPKPSRGRDSEHMR